MTLRIRVDFNTSMADERERVWINTGLQRELESLLRPDMWVVLSDTDLEVSARLEYDAQDGRWYGVPNWSTSRDLPSAAISTA